MRAFAKSGGASSRPLYLTAMRRFTPELMAKMVLGTLPKRTDANGSKSAVVGGAASGRAGTTTRTPQQASSSSSSSQPFALPPQGTEVHGENEAVKWAAQRSAAGPRRGRAGQRVHSDPTTDEQTSPFYRCIECDTPLFSLHTDHLSGTSTIGHHLTGWPSFCRPIKTDAIALSTTMAERHVRVADPTAAAGNGGAAATSTMAPRPMVLNSERTGRSVTTFRADEAALANSTISVQVDSANEIRRWHKNVPFHIFSDKSLIREHQRQIKVAKRLWQGSRGGGNSERMYIGKCACCSEPVCYVSAPSGGMSPSYVVSAAAVYCDVPERPAE